MPGLEVVAPEEVLVPVRVHVSERHRVGAVEASDLRHDLDVLEAVADQLEARNAVRVDAPLFVPRHRALEAADEQIDLPVAVDVGRVRDVLAIREDRRAGHVLQAVGREHERRGLRRSFVSVVADVAEELLGEKVQVPVPVEVDEAVPLADLEVTEAVGAVHEGNLRIVHPLEEHDPVRSLLDEEVVVPVTVDVHQLGPGGC